MLKLSAALSSLRADTETIKRYQERELELSIELNRLKADYAKSIHDASEVREMRKQIEIMRNKVSEATKMNE
jgi:hypothetical protein